MQLEDYIKQHYEEKRKLFILLIIIISFQLIIESIIFKLPIEKYLKHTILNVFTYCIILIPIPFFYYLGFKKNLIYIFSLLAVGIFTITIFIETQLIKSYYSFLFIITYFVILFINKLYKESLSFLGLNFSKLKIALFYGIPIGIFLYAHLLVSANLTKAFNLTYPKLDNLFFLLGLNSLAEELFYRGFIFNELHKYGFASLPAATISSIICLLRYLINPSFLVNPFMLTGAIFYLLLVNITLCFLFKTTKTIYTTIIVNLLFSLGYYSIMT